MKKLLIIAAGFFATAAQADYRLIVPQNPGGGTSVWATVMQPHLEKALGEKVIIEHIPGANDVPGFNKFHNELRKDPKVIMVAHGGNAEAYLTERVDYDYDQYAPIALVNLNIVVSHAKGFDPYKDQIKTAYTSGRRPDLMAATMLACGPMPTVNAYVDCYKKKIVLVKGMSGNEARLAAMRGDLNVTRETFVAHKKFIEKEGKFDVWFDHGVLDIKAGKVVKDRNFKTLSFEEAYKAKWGKAPSGDFYEAYLLAKNWRDVLQKSLWVDKNNPNAEALRAAIRKMLADPEAMKAIIADGGDYDWLVGDDMGKAYAVIRRQIKPSSLKALVEFTDKGMGFPSQYKAELTK